MLRASTFEDLGPATAPRPGQRRQLDDLPVREERGDAPADLER
uniref:Uncharacterized protein n=1 Tax=Arundo donax TaxID=35708 RepID=A0A0A9CFQ2_ARUDO